MQVFQEKISIREHDPLIKKILGLEFKFKARFFGEMRRVF